MLTATIAELAAMHPKKEAVYQPQDWSGTYFRFNWLQSEGLVHYRGKQLQDYYMNALVDVDGYQLFEVIREGSKVAYVERLAPSTGFTLVEAWLDSEGERNYNFYFGESPTEALANFIASELNNK